MTNWVSNKSFLVPGVRENICGNLSFWEANQLRKVLGVVELECRFLVSDPDLRISSIDLVNDQTFETYLEIHESGSELTLMKAVEKNQIKIVEMLLKKGVNPNANDEYGNSALNRTAVLRHIEIAKLLIKYGADINLLSPKGIFPLEEAVFHSYGRYEMIRLFLENGADVHQVNKYGKTVIHAVNMDLGSLKIIVGAGADVNAVNEDNYTALMTASLNPYNPQIVKFLLEKGANPNIINKYRNTALSLAKYIKNEEAIQMLLKAGAKY